MTPPRRPDPTTEQRRSGAPGPFPPTPWNRAAVGGCRCSGAPRLFPLTAGTCRDRSGICALQPCPPGPLRFAAKAGGAGQGHGLPRAQGLLEPVDGAPGLLEPVNGAPRLLGGQGRLGFSPHRDILGYSGAQCSGRASAAQCTEHPARPRLELGR